MCVIEYDFQVPYGVIQKEGYRVKNIVEKPIQRFFVNAGIYVLDQSLIQRVNMNEHLDMTTLLDSSIKENDQVNMFPIHEYWMDIGRMDEYDRAQKDVSGIFE